MQSNWVVLILVTKRGTCLQLAPKTSLPAENHKTRFHLKYNDQVLIYNLIPALQPLYGRFPLWKCSARETIAPRAPMEEKICRKRDISLANKRPYCLKQPRQRIIFQRCVWSRMSERMHQLQARHPSRCVARYTLHTAYFRARESSAYID